MPPREESVTDNFLLKICSARADALRKLHRVALIPEATGRKDGTHPDLRERAAVDLAEPPDESQYPRAAVDTSRAYLGVVLYITCFLGALAVSEPAISKLW